MPRLRASQTLEMLAILAVIAAGVAFGAYFYMNTLQHAAGGGASLTVETVKAQLVDQNHVDVTLQVRNTGSVPVNVTQIKVVYGGTELTCSFEPLPVTLQPGARQPIDGNCTSSAPLTVGGRLDIRVYGYTSSGTLVPASATATIYG